MRIKSLLAAGVAALSLGSAANAATITYTFNGTFTGTLNGQAFSTGATFTGIGDTDTLYTQGLTRYVNLDTVFAVAGGTTYNLQTTTQFYLNGGNYAGLFFGCCGNGGGGFSGTGPGLVGYDAVSSLANTPLTLTFAGPVTFNTDQGVVQISGFENGSFGASVAGVVPEPGTWALLILGFGAVGGAMRRRPRTTVAYA